MLLNGGSTVARQSLRLLKALKMLDVVRSVFMSVWAACTVMGFQNAMPPRLKGRLALSRQANHSRTLLDGHTSCLIPPTGMICSPEAG